MSGKYNPFKGSLIVSIIIIIFGALIHYTSVKPNNWGAFLLWIPVYISPMWALAGASWVSERGKE